MVGARTAVLVVPPTIYLLSNFHRVAPAVVAADLMKAFSITAASLGALAAIYPYVSGAILNAAWTRLVSGGVRSYPEAGYRTAFGVCLGLATGAVVSTLFVTETRCRNIWKRAAH
jgi:hypothetical protein